MNLAITHFVSFLAGILLTILWLKIIGKRILDKHKHTLDNLEKRLNS